MRDDEPLVMRPVWPLLIVVGIATIVAAINLQEALSPGSWEVEWPIDEAKGVHTTLRIPAGLANSGMMVDVPTGGDCSGGSTQPNLVLKTRWPDLTALTPMEAYRAWSNGAHPDVQLGPIFEVSVTSRPYHHCSGKLVDALQDELDSALHNVTNFWAPTRLPNMANANKEQWGHKEVHLEQPDEKEAKFGLRHIGIDFKKYPDVPKGRYGEFSYLENYSNFNDDVFYTMPSSGPLKTVIVCDPEEVDYKELNSRPFCRQNFVVERLNALVIVRYRPEELKDWEQIQAKITALLESFTQTK